MPAQDFKEIIAQAMGCDFEQEFESRNTRMEIFQASIQSWQVFYATVAAVSATLTGLLFVSLSLNRDRLKDRIPIQSSAGPARPSATSCMC